MPTSPASKLDARRRRPRRRPDGGGLGRAPAAPARRACRAAEGRPSRDEAFAALAATSSRRSPRSGPTVLVFEDLHWADDDLLDFVDELVDELDACRSCSSARRVPSSCRAGQAGVEESSTRSTFSLAPLSDDETAQAPARPCSSGACCPPRRRRSSSSAPRACRSSPRSTCACSRAGMPETISPRRCRGSSPPGSTGCPLRTKELLQDAAVLGKVFWTDALRRPVGSRRTRSWTSSYACSSGRSSCVASGDRPSRGRGSTSSSTRSCGRPRTVRSRAPLAPSSTAERQSGSPPCPLIVEKIAPRRSPITSSRRSSYGQAAGLEVDDLRPQLIHALTGRRRPRPSAQHRLALGRVLPPCDRSRPRAPVTPSSPGCTPRHQCGRRASREERSHSRRRVELLLAAGRNDLAALAMTLLDRALWNAGKADPSLLDRALELVADTGPTPLRGRVVSAVAVRWAIAGRPDEALPLAREALEIARAHGDRDAEVEALNNVAVSQVNGRRPGRRPRDRAGMPRPGARVRCARPPAAVRQPRHLRVRHGESRGRLPLSPRRSRARRAPREQGESWTGSKPSSRSTTSSSASGTRRCAMPDSSRAVGANAGHCTTSTRSSGSSRRRSCSHETGSLPAGLIGEVLEQARSIGDPQIVEPALGQATALWLVTGHADEGAGLSGRVPRGQARRTSIFSWWATSRLSRARVAAAVERPRARRPAGRPCRRLDSGGTTRLCGSAGGRCGDPRFDRCEDDRSRRSSARREVADRVGPGRVRATTGSRDCVLAVSRCDSTPRAGRRRAPAAPRSCVLVVDQRAARGGRRSASPLRV